MLEVHPIAVDLGELFADAGYELALVGGSVRDLFLNKKAAYDLDFATSALPDECSIILKLYCDEYWEVGKKFGTIGGIKNGVQIEITTYRTDEYDHKTRKPLVKYGKTLESDLSRRDFTINALAIRLPQIELVDNYQGLSDLNAKILRTPIDAHLSFADDPLRMMRAIRFISTLGFELDKTTSHAITKMADELKIVSKERIRDELEKLICGNNPAKGIDAMVKYGLSKYIIPEIDALKMEVDPLHHHKDVYMHSLKVLNNAIEWEQKDVKELDDIKSPDLVIRLAALLHDIAKPNTRKFSKGGKVSFKMHDIIGSKMAYRILKNLRFPNQIVKDVSRLVELHMRFFGYGEQKWTDSAVRRYANDAGHLLSRLHILTRSDVTTQNSKKALYLAKAYDDIVSRIEELKEKEEFESIRPDLNGYEIADILKLDLKEHKSGIVVGNAYKFLLQWRIDDGPHSKDDAKQYLINNFK